MPAQDPRPNTDDPPRILGSEVSGSATTPNDAVFLVTQGGYQLPNARTSVPLTLDILDDDSNPVFARAFVIGPSPASAFDAGVTDAGAATPFVRRFFIESVVLSDDGRGRAVFNLPADQFSEAGRCYAIEVRVSSRFLVGADAVGNPDERHLPETEQDLDLIRFWVASYGPSATSVDLSTCPVQP